MSFKDIWDTASDRLKSPLWAAFAFSWVIWNKKILIAVCSGAHWERKIEYVEENFGLLCGFFVPLLCAVFIVSLGYVLSYLLGRVRNWFEVLLEQSHTNLLLREGASIAELPLKMGKIAHDSYNSLVKSHELRNSDSIQNLKHLAFFDTRGMNEAVAKLTPQEAAEYETKVKVILKKSTLKKIVLGHFSKDSEGEEA